MNSALGKSALAGLVGLSTLLWGCGGANTFSKDFTSGAGGSSGPTPDFTITVFNGTPGNVQDGAGKTPNSDANPVVDDSMTIVIKPTHGFAGTVQLSSGPASTHFSITQPLPSSVTVNGSGFSDAKLDYGNDSLARGNGSANITASSGGITHTYMVFFTSLASGTGAAR